MKRTLIVRPELQELLRHLPPMLKGKIKQALEEIVENPSSGKALREELAGLSSTRIGRIRIVYRAEEHRITLITIGPRRMVYQKAALELNKQRG